MTAQTTDTGTEGLGQLVELIRKNQEIKAALAALQSTEGGDSRLALPSGYTLHDLETSAALRRRARGMFDTGRLNDFMVYIDKHGEIDGTSLFVDGAGLVAIGVLNMGSTYEPGHADNKARLRLAETPEYHALLQINSSSLKQAAFAEWLEDWHQQTTMTFFAGDEEIKAKQAISAVRSITLESLSKIESDEQQLSTARSAFESVTASSKHKLPTLIYFACRPALDLSERTYVLRLSVLTEDKAPVIRARIVGLESHKKECADELAALIKHHPFGKGLPIYSGSYEKGA